uniref:Uncharacterized protein n=2 Tax=Anguilla anguilla TaxID=7936 RepID=A0A0E9VJW0_ANGAN
MNNSNMYLWNVERHNSERVYYKMILAFPKTVHFKGQGSYYVYCITYTLYCMPIEII